MKKTLLTGCTILTLASNTLAEKQVCCDPTSGSTVTVNDDGSTKYNDNKKTDPIPDSVLSSAAGAVSQSLNISLPSGTSLGLSFSSKERSGSIEYTDHSHEECCNKSAKTYTKWLSPKATVNLGNMSASGSYSPINSEWLSIVTFTSITASSTSGSSTRFFYETVCSPNVQSRTGITTTGDVLAIPVSLTLATGIECRAGFRLAGITLASVTAAAGAEVQAQATANIRISISTAGTASATYEGPIQGKSIILTIHGMLQTEILAGLWQDRREIQESITLL